MKNTYKQLSSEDRDKIAILRAQGISYYDISIAIGRDKGTVSREINRNRTPIYNVYLPHKAHERAKERKQNAGIRDKLSFIFSNYSDQPYPFSCIKTMGSFYKQT